jgi:hypothetical protein
MPQSLAPPRVLDREFLTIRARLVDLAAALDRIDRAEGSAADDPRVEKIRRGLGVLAGKAAGRAEQVQMIFSLPYKDDWQKQYGLK